MKTRKITNMPLKQIARHVDGLRFHIALKLQELDDNESELSELNSAYMVIIRILDQNNLTPDNKKLLIQKWYDKMLSVTTNLQS